MLCGGGELLFHKRAICINKLLLKPKNLSLIVSSEIIVRISDGHPLKNESRKTKIKKRIFRKIFQKIIFITPP
jgi:hypothetical protein